MSELIFWICGLVGNLAFAFKSSFQVVNCFKSKSTAGLSLGMIIFDFIGNMCCAAYIWGTTGFTVWLQFVNYGFATLFLIILLVMKYTYKTGCTNSIK